LYALTRHYFLFLRSSLIFITLPLQPLFIMKTPRLLLLIGLALLAPTLSWADVIFTLGNNPQPGEENVLLNNGTTGSTVTGTTNQSGLTVNFSSATQILSEPSSGQARIEATNNGSQVSLSDVSFGLTNGGTFTDAIFNMFVGGTIGSSGGTVTITAVANDGTFTFSTTTGNGSNFLTVTTANGEVLTQLGISATVGFTDLRQVRISGATGPTPVPDTGATLPLLGSTLTAFAVLRRKLVPC
jgi:hypothetical protein